MLAIARILRTGARFLMLDEPTEGLAPVIIQQIGRTMAEFKNEGFTILLVEQNFRFASTFADRYFVMEHGRIIDSFASSELAQNMDALHDISASGGVMTISSRPGENERRRRTVDPAFGRRRWQSRHLPQHLQQLLVGLINGSFYALLSLGLAVIFGMLNIVNFAHGAFYMMGAFGAYFLLNGAGLDYWWALILSPLAIGAFGALIEVVFLKRLAGFDPLYSLLLTFGLALIFQGLFQNLLGASGLPYRPLNSFAAAAISASCFCPIYRGWVIVASAASASERGS